MNDTQWSRNRLQNQSLFRYGPRALRGRGSSSSFGLEAKTRICPRMTFSSLVTIFTWAVHSSDQSCWTFDLLTTHHWMTVFLSMTYVH